MLKEKNNNLKVNNIMKQLKKTLLTLVALLAVTTQAWAEETPIATILASENSTFVSGSKTFADMVKITFSGAVDWLDNRWEVVYDSTNGNEGTVTVEGINGTNISKVVFYDNYGSHVMTTSPYTLYFYQAPEESSFSVCTGANGKGKTNINMITKIEVFGAAASSGPEVAWNAAEKTGSFTMPGGNVTLEPEYYPQATFATGGAPTAINDVPATTDGAIVNAGTVANIGETTKAQGTVMYYVSQTEMTDAALLALAADAWTADVPTAESLTEGQAYVYYYVRGNDSDNDEENFSDGDILSANALTVTIAAEPTYAVTFADGVNPEPPAEPEWTASPATDVKKGTEVTVTYTGTKKVIGVKAEKSDGSKRLDVSTVGMIVCTNGKAYPVNMKDNLPSGVTAVGIVAYKNGKNGLVMALTDEASNMNWGTATGNNGANAHTPAVEGYSWKVLTIGEWQYNIFSGAGVGNLAGLSTYMTAAGGTGLQNGCYWTSTPKNNSYYARCIKIENGSINFSPGADAELKSNGYHVRAFFAF